MNVGRRALGSYSVWSMDGTEVYQQKVGDKDDLFEARLVCSLATLKMKLQIPCCPQ